MTILRCMPRSRARCCACACAPVCWHNRLYWCVSWAGVSGGALLGFGHGGPSWRSRCGWGAGGGSLNLGEDGGDAPNDACREGPGPSRSLGCWVAWDRDARARWLGVAWVSLSSLVSLASRRERPLLDFIARPNSKSALSRAFPASRSSRAFSSSVALRLELERLLGGFSWPSSGCSRSSPSLLRPSVSAFLRPRVPRSAVRCCSHRCPWVPACLLRLRPVLLRYPPQRLEGVRQLDQQGLSAASHSSCSPCWPSGDLHPQVQCLL